MPSLSLAIKKNKNQQVLLKIAESILILAKQDITLCGDGTEEDDNFMQLLKLRIWLWFWLPYIEESHSQACSMFLSRLQLL